MPKNLGVNTTLADALDILSVWKTIPDFKMGDVSLNDYTGAVTATDGLAKQHANNAVERSGLKANLNDNVRQLNELVTRFRSGIRATYGPDSPLYEQAGGTRTSSRKSPKRAAVAAPEPGKPADPVAASAPQPPSPQHA